MTENTQADRGSSSFYEFHGRYHGVLGWIFSTDHKRIGLLYLATVLPLFFPAVYLGGPMACGSLHPGPS